MDAKITMPEQRQALESLVELHNQRWNPSGVPYKGSKRPVQSASLTNEADGAVSLPQPQADPASIAFRLQHEGGFEVLFDEDGAVWLQGTDEDVIVGANTCLFKLWGDYLTDKSQKKEMAKCEAFSFPLQVTSEDFKGVFAVESGGELVEEYPEAKSVSTFEQFLTFLESSGITGYKLQVHNIDMDSSKASH